MSDNNSFTSHFIELTLKINKINNIYFYYICYFYTFAEQIYSFLVNPYAEAVKDDQHQDV